MTLVRYISYRVFPLYLIMIMISMKVIEMMIMIIPKMTVMMLNKYCGKKDDNNKILQETFIGQQFSCILE